MAEQTESTGTRFATIEEAIDDIRRGRMVVVCDDENRENEGDLTMAAQFATPEAINFMAKEARGLICLALTPDRCDQLGLDLMAAKNESPFQTAFTISVEAREGVTTGISAADRARTIQVAVDPTSGPEDLVQPGHVFPLKSKEGGVLERAGQTEAAVDLARLAGVIPAGVICEVMNEDGTMARVPDLVPYCERHELKMITVADLIAYRPPPRAPGRTGRGDEAPDGVRRVQRGRLSLARRRQASRGDGQGRHVSGRKDVLVRVHSECLTGDVFHSLRCDCGEQLAAALAMIEEEGQGVLLYLLPGGAGDRPAEQAPRLPAAEMASTRSTPTQARAARGPTRLRDRRPDPGRPRPDEHPDPHQQPEEDPRSRGLRAVGGESRSQSTRCPTHTTRAISTRSGTRSATSSITRDFRSTRSSCTRSTGATSRRRRSDSRRRHEAGGSGEESA